MEGYSFMYLLSKYIKLQKYQFQRLFSLDASLSRNTYLTTTYIEKIEVNLFLISYLGSDKCEIAGIGISSGGASFTQTNQPQRIRGIPGHVVGVNNRNDED